MAGCAAPTAAGRSAIDRPSSLHPWIQHLAAKLQLQSLLQQRCQAGRRPSPATNATGRGWGHDGRDRGKAELRDRRRRCKQAKVAGSGVHKQRVGDDRVLIKVVRRRDRRRGQAQVRIGREAKFTRARLVLPPLPSRPGARSELDDGTGRPVAAPDVAPAAPPSSYILKAF